jgi:wobble nucleotide-excising tRNase
MKQSMSTKKLSAIIQISELDQMLTDLKQTIEQRDSKIARLQLMILEKRQSAIGYRDFIVLKNSQEELRELCKKIDLQMVKTNELLRHIRNTKVIFSDLLLLEAEVNEQMSKIQELSNAFFIQEEAGK